MTHGIESCGSSCYHSRVTSHAIDFEDLNRRLNEQGSALGAAELHGVLTGLQCVITSPQPDLWLNVAFGGLDAMPELDGITLSMLEDLYQESVKGLDHLSFEFSLMLPDDDTSVAVRAGALADWATGFLAAVAATGISDWPEEVTEFINDLGQIASQGHQVADDTDSATENDLMELIEYVRVGVMLASTQLAAARES